MQGVLVCGHCYQQPPPYLALRSACYFQSTVREMIHRLKYKRARHLALPLGRLLVPLRAALPQPGELIVPVPLYSTREAARGYNQSLLLAQVLAEELRLPVESQALRRRRDTPAQVGLSAAERQRNVRDAFVAEPSLVKGRDVLLIDDVCTTGATVSACADALRRAGARSVVALTVARALDSPGSVSPP